MLVQTMRPVLPVPELAWVNLSNKQLHGDSGEVSGLQQWDGEVRVRIGNPEAGDSDGEGVTLNDSLSAAGGVICQLQYMFPFKPCMRRVLARIKCSKQSILL